MITRSLIGSTLLLASGTVMAATVSVSTSVDTGLATAVTGNDMQTMATATSSVNAPNGNPNYYARGSASQTGSVSVASGIDYSYDYGSAIGTDFGNGPHTNMATAVWSDTFVNTGAARQMSLDFNVVGGEIGFTNVWGEAAYSAGFGIRILVDGQTVWTATDEFGTRYGGSVNPFAGYDTGVLSYTGNGPTMFNPDPYVISFDDYFGQIDLGLLNTGDSVDITYEMSVFAISDYFIGNDFIYARFGDPLGVTPAVAVSAVPVPAAVYLFASGLLGLIGVARRRMH